MRASIVERAFQLASSGRCPTLYKLEQLLASEGYDLVAQHLSGPSIRQEIRRRIRAAEKARLVLKANGSVPGMMPRDADSFSAPPNVEKPSEL